MFKQICDSIFRLYLYADNTKKIHYTTDSNHMHELCDKLRDTIIDFTDEFAEQSFGYYGKPKYGDFQSLSKLSIEETDDLNEICDRVVGIVALFGTEFKNDDKLSGIVSLIDDFKGKINQIKFLCTFDKFSRR